MSDGHPLNQLPSKGDPYRGADESPSERVLSHDEMMEATRAHVDYSLLDKAWEAKIFFMTRGECKISVTCLGSTATDAVRKLYEEFRRLQREGWKRNR